jgi:quinoprotein glucose dehydrogenase
MVIKQLAIILVLLVQVLSSFAQNKRTDWPAYGNDAGGNRYSPVQQINTGNVGNLKPAWIFRTGELKTYEGTGAGEKAAFEATPVMVGSTLYFSTPSSRVFAVDATNGKEQWMFDPKINLGTDYSEITSRGVSVWPAAGGQPDKKAERIFVATIDGRLICLDAANGTPVNTFGEQGTVWLDPGRKNRTAVTSPPAIIGNTIVVGSSLGDNYRFDYPQGVVKAYDVLTGKLRWTWNPVPDSTDKGWNTWQGPKAHKSGAANAWAVISADASRDLVFIPTSSPSPDYYGGERLGQNLYGNCIVALRASTGKMVWYYQVVHHDLWDYDIAAQPVLLDVPVKGKLTPAVAVGTKMGHIFILDRETGKPLFPVEERAVPASDIAGEQAHPTQPVPVLPAPLGLQSISEKDAWGVDEKGKAEAVKRIRQYTNKGIFTPPSSTGSLMTPGNAGGIHWGGMCFDPKQSLLITNINNLAAIIRVVPREQFAELRKKSPGPIRAEIGAQLGTPYVLMRGYVVNENDSGLVMQTKPPWGTVLAIDLKTGEKKWETPLGFMLDPAKFPGAENWGSLNFGGAIVTAGNLVFVAASFDGHLRAFDSRSGKEIWKYALPAGGQATPMSYELNGRQYIVIAAGGHGKLGTKLGDYVMAFALP